MTYNREIMGGRVNKWPMRLLATVTVLVTFAASIGLIVTWII